MQTVLLRAGIDTACGGIHSPLFDNGTFEFVPIPDSHGLDQRTYGNTFGRHGRVLCDYFPASMQLRCRTQPMHVDPEFETFTYGDPTLPKRSLSRLQAGDLLVFYAGMQAWPERGTPALYLVGFFEVKLAGFVSKFSTEQLRDEFSANFHVRHGSLFREQREKLILVKGSMNSRLFSNTHRIGGAHRREDGSVWQIISSEMAKIFGRFGGIGSLQRSTPRWVEEKLATAAANFVRQLR
jgi:Nucleotide modification associated domain 3